MTTLPSTKLGRTGLDVTKLGYGALEIRGAPSGREITPERAGQVLNAVLDTGINYIDTSIDYGRSEEFIGRFISRRRSEYFLATKCGCPTGDPPSTPIAQRSPHDFGRENIVSGVEQSLTRLKTDYIDVLQFHHGPSSETLEDNGSVAALLNLKAQGKVRFIGMSSTLPNLLEHIAMGVFDVFQIPYSALQREHEDAITQAARAGAGTVIRGGVAKGAPSVGKQAGNSSDLWQSAGLDELLDGMSPMEFVLRFTLTHPDLHTIIVGTINPDHLRDNLDALHRGPLPQGLYEEAKVHLADAEAGLQTGGS